MYKSNKGMNQYGQERIKQNQLAFSGKFFPKNKESHFNPLQPGVVYLYPLKTSLKTSENL